MAKKIKSIKELPDWYRLENYTPAFNLNGAGWYEQLVQRWFFNYLHEKKQRQPEQDYQYFNKILIKIRSHGVYTLSDDFEIFMIGGGKLVELKNSPKTFSESAHAISPFTLRRLYQCEQNLSEERRNRVRHYMDNIFSTPSELDEKEAEYTKSFIDLPIYNAFDGEKHYWQFDIVEVDLSLPDKLLRQQFENYLKTQRKRLKSTSPQQLKSTSPQMLDILNSTSSKYPEYQKWAKYGILQYIDLKLWEKEADTEIPHRVMADAIFPAGEKGEEAVRKTTKKIADTICTRQYLTLLSKIVAGELAEKK